MLGRCNFFLRKPPRSCNLQICKPSCIPRRKDLEKPFALIIEDDRDIVALFRHVLDLAGYRTEIVLHGKVAAELLGRSTPDIVLLDLGLPGMSGGEILATMRADDRLKNVPVVVITAHPHLVETLPVAPQLVL